MIPQQKKIGNNMNHSKIKKSKWLKNTRKMIHLTNFVLFCFAFVALRIELRATNLLGKYSTSTSRVTHLVT